jgi:hypothetical protein
MTTLDRVSSAFDRFFSDVGHLLHGQITIVERHGLKITEDNGHIAIEGDYLTLTVNGKRVRGFVSTKP